MSSLPKMPAYMEYPADILNNEIFMQLSIAQKGLLWLLRMYCWVNGDIPAKPELIAKLTGISEKDARRLFDENVQSFFKMVWKDNDGIDICTERMINPSLEAYKMNLILKKKIRSENGKKSADKRWDKNGNAITDEMAQLLPWEGI
jgi:uncharacterized protein YdaU (DUF1376 family)